MAVGPPKPWPRDKNGKPLRRVRVPGPKNQNVYWRSDAKLEIGYRDSTGRKRWSGPFDTITAARAERDTILGARGRGDRVQPSPRLRFGEVLDRWLVEQVAELRKATRDRYTSHVDNHLRPLWGNRRMDAIEVATRRS